VNGERINALFQTEDGTLLAGQERNTPGEPVRRGAVKKDEGRDRGRDRTTVASGNALLHRQPARVGAVATDYCAAPNQKIVTALTRTRCAGGFAPVWLRYATSTPATRSR
jgi:hypothetical protein